MTKEKIKNSIYTYISVNIFPQIKEGIDCTKNLFEEYGMDSIAIVELILYLEGVTINKNNEWKFLDNRVEDIFIKYSNFVKDAMEKRDELRTVEKIKVFNENSKILQQISSVRECIDKQCTCCLETLVKLHLDNKGKDYIEFEYQKSVQRFNRFLDEVMNMNVWKYIDKYNNIFMQENL